MQLNDGGEIKKRQISSPTVFQTRVELSVVLAVTILYILFFHRIADIVGPVSASLIAIPVALAGWFFGVRSGLIASLFGIIVTAVLFSNYSGGNWLDWIIKDWPGMIAGLVLGLVA